MYLRSAVLFFFTLPLFLQLRAERPVTATMKLVDFEKEIIAPGCGYFFFANALTFEMQENEGGLIRGQRITLVVPCADFYRNILTEGAFFRVTSSGYRGNCMGGSSCFHLWNEPASGLPMRICHSMRAYSVPLLVPVPRFFTNPVPFSMGNGGDQE